MKAGALRKLFARYAEDEQFQIWSQGTPQVRFIYAGEYGTIWKFTPIEWWRFVRKTIGNHGHHEFLLSRALGKRPRHITRDADQNISSSDKLMRCVNPLDWTVQNWMNELVTAPVVPLPPARAVGLQKRELAS